MNETLIKERICNLLESVVDKTENINKSKSSDSLIEIDLVLEDLKHLYNEFFILKKETEKQIERGVEHTDKRLSSTDLASRTFPRRFVTPPPGKEDQGSEHTSPENDDKAKTDENIEQDSNDVKTSNLSSTDDLKDVMSKQKEGGPYDSEKDKVSPNDHESTGTTKDDTSNTSYDEAVREPVQKKTESKDDGLSKTHSEQKKSNKKTKAVGDVVGKKQNESVGDKYVENEDTSLNVRLARMKQEVDIGTSMQQKPIKNLKASIGMNEKFLFINELFDGDIEEYNNAIDKLNSFDSLDEAFNYINQLNENYSWEEQDSSETIDKFAYLVQRRYMTN